jgi:hypothetical protein
VLEKFLGRYHFGDAGIDGKAVTKVNWNGVWLWELVKNSVERPAIVKNELNLRAP